MEVTATIPLVYLFYYYVWPKCFIKAEIINWKDLLDYNGFVNAREKGLIRTEGKEYIVVNGKAYNLEGKEINKFDKKRAIFLRDEKRELEKVLGIEEIGLNDEEFVKALYSTLVDVFGKIKIVDERISHPVVPEIITAVFGNLFAQISG